MIRLPHVEGWRPGIPTLSRRQEAEWLLYAQLGQLMDYLQRRGPLDISDADLRRNADELGLSASEFEFHWGPGGGSGRGGQR